jgi:hypothetical protein
LVVRRPPLEKESDAPSKALIPDAAHPVGIHGACTRSAFPAGDHPISTGQIEPSQMPEKRLEGKEPDRRRSSAKMSDAGLCLRILDRHATPNMRGRLSGPVSGLQIAGQQGASFRQHLKDMPIRPLHRVEDLINEVARHFLMEQVAHRVDEDRSRAFPGQRLFQALMTQDQIEVLKRMACHPAKASDR